MSVTVRYWAAAKAAAGVPEEVLDAGGDLATVLDAVRARHGEPLATVLARCSYLVDEVSPGKAPPVDVAVGEGAVVDVLPPFAGGAPSAGGRAAAEHHRAEQRRAEQRRAEQRRAEQRRAEQHRAAATLVTP